MMRELHPAQKWGEASEELLRAIWDRDLDAIRRLPVPSGLNDDDWVHLRGRKAIHSGLWEALCTIISPSRMSMRGGLVERDETEMLKLLIERRPRGIKGILRGCLWTASTSFSAGSCYRALSPIAAVLSLCMTPCDLPGDEADPRRAIRARACLRCFLDAGAQAEDTGPFYYARAASRKYAPETYACCQLLLERCSSTSFPDYVLRKLTNAAQSHWINDDDLEHDVTNDCCVDGIDSDEDDK